MRAINGAAIVDGRAYLVGQVARRSGAGGSAIAGAVERAGGSPPALT